MMHFEIGGEFMFKGDRCKILAIVDKCMVVYRFSGHPRQWFQYRVESTEYLRLAGAKICA